MGQGIAQVAAQAGLDVMIVDAAPDFAQKGIAQASRSTLDRLVEKGKLDGARARRDAGAPASRRRRTAISPTATSSIEAATENEELKLAIFKSLGEVVQATTRSSRRTRRRSRSPKLARGVSARPERVIGMHFMNPVPLMKLVEIVRGLPTERRDLRDRRRALAEALRQDRRSSRATSRASSSTAC